MNLESADRSKAVRAERIVPVGSLIETLRDRARRDDPASLLAAADLDAWAHAEGPGSVAAAEATGRKDAERWIPGLPARRTYKALGWMALAAFVVDSALSWLPQSDLVETLDTLVCYGTAIPGVALAGWSLVSEVRGWEGSDAATWFAKARVGRHEKALAARRDTMAGTLLAIGADGLSIYRDVGGAITHDTVSADAILDLALEAGPHHGELCLTTATGVRRFGWLPRDPVFEAAVRRLAATVATRSRSVVVASA